MKRYILPGILLVVLLLTAADPIPGSAWFGYDQTLAAGHISIPSRQWVTLGPRYFNDQRPGLVALTDDGFTTSYDGLITISGTCSADPVGRLRMRLLAGGQTYPLVDVAGRVGSFTITLPAQPLMQIQVRAAYARTPERGDDAPVCYLLFEKP